MNVKRKYINQEPPRADLVKFCLKLTDLTRDFKELFPQSQGWEINLCEMMIEISADTAQPYHAGMMCAGDKSMDKEFANSLADDIGDHIGRHLHRR